MATAATGIAIPITGKTDPVSAARSVLILTHRFDPTADKVVDELNRRGVPLFRCDAAEFPEGVSVSAELAGRHWSGHVRTVRRRLELDEVMGIYYRLAHDL